jgi:predicted AlkP superfamily phosphohydrolase/phosphomutase
LLQFRRKSQPFWKILGDYGVFSTVIRVPITFPPEKFNGLLLSAMSVPDLKGSQGTFSYFTSDPHEQATFTGGTQIPVEVINGVVSSFISGPDNPLRPNSDEMRIPFQVLMGKNGEPSKLVLQKKEYPLELREFTPWIRVAFRSAPGVKVSGLCHFYLKATSPHFKMYMSPLNIDPDKAALPISHPSTYAPYLAKTQGDFSTLGLAEDTWALNERVLDEEAFLKQAYMIHEERERMFFDALEKTRRGVVVCVFDITDRLQHMFWRYLEADHPANQGKDVQKHRDAIRDLYQKMDDLVGRVVETLPEDTVLMVMSDHGFKSFKRGVNLNTWLHQNGYLAVKDRPTGTEWFQDVDWTQTRAYALGLGGIYLNLAGREAQGTVKPGEDAQALKREIIQGLRKLYDEEWSLDAVGEVYDTREVYKGPYVEEAPDLVVGFKPGYRVSWTCATGAVTEEVFEDNEKSWSGDHCVNPPDVPGILFCNRKIDADQVSIMDIGPTVLDLFGVPVPDYCDGQPLKVQVP